MLLLNDITWRLTNTTWLITQDLRVVSKDIQRWGRYRVKSGQFGCMSRVCKYLLLLQQRPNSSANEHLNLTSTETASTKTPLQCMFGNCCLVSSKKREKKIGNYNRGLGTNNECNSLETFLRRQKNTKGLFPIRVFFKQLPLLRIVSFGLFGQWENLL